MPTIEQIEWWLKTGSTFGLGFVAIAGFLALLFYGTFRGLNAAIGLIQDVRERWLPQVVSSHLTFIETTKVATASTSEAVTRLTESHGMSMDNHGKTHRALECIVRAQQEGDVCEEARKHLDDAVKELQ